MKVGITNLKGGVGKTTISINLAVCFAHMSYKVCIVDTDFNQNSFSWYSVRDVSPEVAAIGATNPGGLTKIVETLEGQYDIVVMDGSPTLSEMNTRVMLSSDILLIPTRPGAHDYRAMEEFIKRLDMVREVKPSLRVYFILNEYDEHLTMHRAVKESLAAFQISILATTLKSRVAYGESNLSGTGAYEHSDDKARQEIKSLAVEVMDLIQIESPVI